ncbi:hypothetical protein Ddye_020404 [Dipteronia dyeriana]|uniref:Uncharacterized protein n=1 Tax=Dipteronia dyeriana TaxID=168575 RepID=A0AAD9WVC4_9ROSI|nr:hypothetical protein Ddye_020404 [Dipteronia dyeriana]
MHFTSIASVDGSRLDKFVHWITVSGSFRSTATRAFEQASCWVNFTPCGAGLKLKI